MITHVYCNCEDQQPEEIKRGVVICLNCNNDILVTQDIPDYDRDLTHDEELAIDEYQQEGICI